MDGSHPIDDQAPRPDSAPEQRSDELAPEGKGVRYVLVACNYCGTDISRVCLATVFAGPAGETVQIFYPMRCPECNHPQVRAPSPIIPGRAFPTPHLT